MPWLRDMPLTTTNERSSISASTAAVEQADQVGVGQPQFAGPVVGECLVADSFPLDPTQPQRDERQVEGAGQALAHSLAHQFRHAVRAVRHGGPCRR